MLKICAVRMFHIEIYPILKFPEVYLMHGFHLEQTAVLLSRTTVGHVQEVSYKLGLCRTAILLCQILEQ